MSVDPKIYDAVERTIRAHLLAQPNGTLLSTVQLVTDAFPNEEETEMAFRAVKTLTYGRLADCWTLGPELTRYGKTVRPKLWCRPVVKACKHCGGEI